MIKRFLFLALGGTLGACSTKPYTHYLIEPEVEVDESFQNSATTPKLEPRAQASDQTITMKWNNGKTYTEVDIPLSVAGRVIVDHDSKRSDSQKKGPRTIIPAPTKSDTVHLQMHHAYLARGLVENKKAPAISLSRARIMMDRETQTQNYGKGLLIADSVLARYPSHPEFLKAQGSLYLLVGERTKAIEAYSKALEVEDDPAVSRKLNELEELE
ncbi:hypothetical protein [Pseudobacteriovorax antillogorgiicola]|uniref:Uncharacterized protein n=1 Tax=Pseudobacteriovorax antillogorgiicola TaxID=1513793 RepID=A0A1Y6CL54_9BACT|nr:hypothetical protein [Pseudobacteriovorax antillogorgiicola]TCS45904.1 hypothetical protein EDD56_12667 [Pseudobacteriovorax antillogorgiicola]SMF71113.1 hypothetical protein SAMN06296036_12631 [Pseudobacteriovorax antillogorgiicola]